MTLRDIALRARYALRKQDRRGGAMRALRAAAIAAAILAFAGLTLPFPTRARTVVALIDASDSVGRDGVEASREAALSLIRGLGRRDRAAVAVFAGRTATIASPVAPALAASLLESADLEAPSHGSTDISAAIAAGNSLAAEGPGTRSIYLFSDGRTNAGASPVGPAQGFGSSGGARATLYSVPAGKAAAGLSTESLALPGLVHSGERASLSWSLVSDRRQRIRYALSVDGKAASTGEASVSPGRNEIPLSVAAGDEGRHAILVEAFSLPDQGPAGEASAAGEPSLAGDASVAESRWGAYLDVAGPARVLLVSGSAFSPLAAAFRTQGSSVVPGGPELLPEDAAGYGGVAAVVLDDLPALAITEAQQARLQDYVAGGGGLLVVGGESSLGRGEYYATPLEDMLPVETDSRQRLQYTRAKLLFVIDHSGSMSETVGGESKQTAAMRGVAASIADLSPLDEVAIMGFDTSPTWVLPFTRANAKDKIVASLSDLAEGGGTDLSTAMAEVIKAFGDPGPTKRHAIVLTDGLTPTADFKGLAGKLSAAGVSVSTIGIGDEVNESLLKDIAQWCNGTYYHADAQQIPSIIDKETLRMTRFLIQEGRISTRIASASPVSEGFETGLPPLSGYLLTKAKPLAKVAFEARLSVGSSEWDPLLATWRYGNGMAAVFTSDSGKRWLSAWSGLGAYNRLWGQALRSVLRASPDGSLRASATVEGGGARVVVEAQGQDGRTLTALKLVGRADSGGEGATSPFELEETAPGRYEGFALVPEAGLAGFDVLDPISGAKASTWVWKSPGLESALGPDKGALSIIASSRGGELLPAAGLAPRPPTISWDRRGFQLPLLALAALLLVADLYLRSTMAGQFGRARAALAAWWAAQRALAEASRAKRWPDPDLAAEREKERRFAEMQVRLAEHVSRRYSEDKSEEKPSA